MHSKLFLKSSLSQVWHFVYSTSTTLTVQATGWYTPSLYSYIWEGSYFREEPKTRNVRSLEKPTSLVYRSRVGVKVCSRRIYATLNEYVWRDSARNLNDSTVSVLLWVRTPNKQILLPYWHCWNIDSLLSIFSCITSPFIKFAATEWTNTVRQSKWFNKSQ